VELNNLLLQTVKWVSLLHSGNSTGASAA